MIKENVLKITTISEGVEEEATSRPDIFQFFRQGNCIFINEKSRNFKKGWRFKGSTALGGRLIICKVLHL